MPVRVRNCLELTGAAISCGDILLFLRLLLHLRVWPVLSADTATILRRACSALNIDYRRPTRTVTEVKLMERALYRSSKLRIS